MNAKQKKEIDANFEVLAQKFNGALKECGLPDLAVKDVSFAANDEDGCPDGQHAVYVNVGGRIIRKCVPNP